MSVFPLSAVGELRLASAAGQEISLVGKGSTVTLEAAAVSDLLRLWRDLGRAGLRPARTTATLTTRFDCDLEVRVNRISIAARQRPGRLRLKPFGLLRAVIR